MTPHPSLRSFHPATQTWFTRAFGAPTPAQAQAFEAIARGESTLLVAPTGSGKTLAAFLASLDRVLFSTVPERLERCRVLYVSPLKALATDVEKNLRAPLAGILATAEEQGAAALQARAWVRSGDTSQGERAKFLRHPADIVITTPESLYLLLTSRARERLKNVHTVIVDEIHVLVGTKRGAHLALSLERLEALTQTPPIRIGLSATVTPHDEVARYLGGFTRGTPRPVTVLAPPMQKKLALQVEMPLPALKESAWDALYPRLLELVLAHKSTLVFVNSRRVAERLATGLNDRAKETLAYAHHGSLARAQREHIETELKAGHVRALVATSSLELGIDMGAVDLVVQVEAPPSIASGLQRLGRAGHQVGAVSEGVIFPKHKGDLVASAAATRAMLERAVEPMRYPHNPLDILAQQIVAAVSLAPWQHDALYERMRGAASFASLSQDAFDSVLELLAGRYVSQDFASLKPRITWDRASGELSAREGAKQVAIANAGTIPDRGLFGVFLSGRDKPVRVGELDEEMVFELRTGYVFLLGASSWRVDEITLDRVLVSPAHGAPAMMPFWRGDATGRPASLGKRIASLLHDLETGAPDLARDYQLTEPAAQALTTYVREQREASALPTSKRVVIERSKDASGEWRLCVLSALGGRVLGPWCMAIVAKGKERLGRALETVYVNDGFVIRLQDEHDVIPRDVLFPKPEELEPLLTGEIFGTALFSARFRENAARALLLPKRRAQGRTPLWVQRKRAQDLLSAAARYPTFPMLTETARECLRDVFDLPELRALLGDVATGAVSIDERATETPSPFAASVLFNYAANYLYEGDVPMAERRAQALTLDRAHLQDLLGDAELRGLLDPEVLAETTAELSYATPERRAQSKDRLHDLLLRVGDLNAQELTARADPGLAEALVHEHRAFWIALAGEPRLVAAEDAVRYHSVLGTPLPAELPTPLRAPVPDPERDLVLRFAATRGPFVSQNLTQRYIWPNADAVLERLRAEGRIVQGAFLPNGTTPEWCDKDVLDKLRRRSLQKLRAEIKPAAPEVFTRALLHWHGITQERRGLDALLDTVETLQGAPLVASELERSIIPARLKDYATEHLDTLLSAGEVLWAGRESLGTNDGKLSLYLTDGFPKLWQPQPETELTEQETRVLSTLKERGALAFDALRTALGGTFAQSIETALWSLVWKGLVHNDGLFALRTFLTPKTASPTRKQALRKSHHGRFRSRRALHTQAVGRWSVVPTFEQNATERLTAQAESLLTRHGVVWRETLATESGVATSAFQEIYKALEARGRVRRGYFVEHVGAMQFAWPHALEALRAAHKAPESCVNLATVDPAQPYGALLPWPSGFAEAQRRGSTKVVLINGGLAAYVPKGGTKLTVAASLSPRELDLVAEALQSLAAHEPMFIESVNDGPTLAHPLQEALARHGFIASGAGFVFARTH